MMFLESLRRQPAHGYALVQHIQRRSNNPLQVEEGSLLSSASEVAQGNNAGLALCARSRACRGNQAPAIGSSRPHRGSKTAWPAASVGHNGCV